MKRTSRRPRRNPSPLDNPAFRRWFGASKVVDERGEPLVVYHGSKARGIGAFAPTKGLEAGTGRALHGEGVYFSSDRSEAEEYVGKEGQVYSVYLRVSRPFVPGENWFGPSAEGIAKRYMTELVNERYAREKWEVARRHKSLLREVLPPRVLTDMMISEGHDGVISGRHVIVFDPRQIKSATDNVGTFDPSDPSILRNRRSSKRTSRRRR